MGTASSREPALTFAAWQTLVHPLVAWKTVTFALQVRCFPMVLQTTPNCGADPSHLWAAD